jgi:hypothetical protein
MKYNVQGKGTVTLVGTDFMASGGEAQIFKKGGTIYKIYHKPSEMIPDGKIQELQAITKKNVLIPKEVITDSKGTRVGFTMDYIVNILPLCKLFTNTYIEQNDVSNDTIIELVKVMQETIQAIHAASCIQVDGNELNYLVDEKTHKNCYFIDVNSYQTKSYPATVIMPSIRDWTTNVFNELTDWYSFATIACQLFIGIHPYKGKHPDFKKFDIESRMKAHVSVFNKQVQLPKSVRDFSRIPSHYMDWFIDVLEKGKRVMPPSTVGSVDAKVTYTIVVSTDNFDIKEIEEFDDVVLHHSNINSIPLTRTKKSVYIGSNAYRVNKSVYLVNTHKKSIPVLVDIKDGNIAVKSLSNHFDIKVGATIQAEELMVVNNTVYARNGGNFLETYFLENTTSATLVVKNIWSIHENSSVFFKNLIVQDLLGSKYISIPIPNVKDSVFHNIRCAVLDNYKILDAKYEGGICVLSVSHIKDNAYGLIVITDIKDVENSNRFIATDDYNAVNFVALDNGIVLLLYEDTLEIFSAAKASKVKMIKDKQLSTDMMLCKRGAAVRFFTDKKLYSIAMKTTK